ncbi:Mitochondrial ribosomal protein MRP51, fungi [Lasallia pustulata]|uniref:Mitochondrial ribosomal protein MRP51, fungi n=1 Tax=Lasallia pustulata TaxID=136370 RepID=A0A1W5DCL6_9LECA|nr:Mitochondrial ribosomal protein MRP51, fungi [Lasallia pustulata]
MATSTPTIRVDAVDSIDHITDFRSSADHVLTLRKWQEMDIPISIPEPPRKPTASSFSQATIGPPRSVFEAQVDNTELTQQNTGIDQQRWKYKGPWLAGKTDGDFEEYIRKEIKRRKIKFRQFLRERLLEKKAIAQKREAMENGELFEPSAVQMSDQEFNLHVKSLREGHIELNTLVHQFLDLPPSPSDQGSGPRSLASVYSEQGPPKTHPSAGLSYNRTNSYIQNHPLLGPQEYKTPVLGRVLKPQNASSSESKAKVGVGGIVAEDPESALFKGRPKDAKYVPGLASFDPNIPGGAKVWVQPQQASIDSEGKIKLRYERAEKSTVIIYEEKVQDEPLPEVTKGYDRQAPDLAPSTRPRAGSRTGYGLDRPSERALPLRSDNAPDVTPDQLLNMMGSSLDR